MAENIPPTSATSTAVANIADQPGRPYYESLRVNLRQILEKKRKLDEQLATLEDQIYKAEGTYLEETANSGNIVRGFDGWVKGVQLGGSGSGGRAGAGDDRRRARIREDERVFSRSSVGWMRAQEGSDSNPTSHAATPTGSTAPQVSMREGAMKGNNKKKRGVDRDDEDEGKAPKRGKITYARD